MPCIILKDILWKFLVYLWFDMWHRATLGEKKKPSRLHSKVSKFNKVCLKDFPLLNVMISFCLNLNLRIEEKNHKFLCSFTVKDTAWSWEKTNIPLALMSTKVRKYNTSNGRIKSTRRIGNKDHARPIRNFQLLEILEC